MHQQKVELIELDLNNPDQIGCMYKVRTHPLVAPHFLGPAPKKFLDHVQYLCSVKNKTFFVVSVDQTLCGYCQSTDLPDEIELGWALHPDFWGKGIGSIAVQKLIETMVPRKKKLVLFVKKNNIRALSIYQKQHFRISHEHQEDILYKMTYAPET